MAIDNMAAISYGVFPTPTPTTTRRAALAISMGLLNIDLPVWIAPVLIATRKWLTIFKRLRR